MEREGRGVWRGRERSVEREGEGCGEGGERGGRGVWRGRASFRYMYTNKYRTLSPCMLLDDDDIHSIIVLCMPSNVCSSS